MKKINIMAGVAFIAGLGAFHLYAAQLRSEIGGGEAIAVLVVSQDLQPGAQLTEKSLTRVEVPSAYVHDRRIRDKSRDELVGLKVSKRLRAGDALMWSDLADGAAHKHLASLITDGRRAYSVDSDANPLGRLLKVGDHVDVLLEAGGRTSLIVERLLVLAVGDRLQSEEASGDASRRSGVTLSVSLAEAELLLSAEARGELRLLLRNTDDLRLRESQKMSEVGPSRRLLSRKQKSESKEIEHVR